MIRRPLLLLAGGFVLGEGMILSGRTVWTALFAAIAAALPVLVCALWHTHVSVPGLDETARFWIGVAILAAVVGAFRGWRELWRCETEAAYGLDGTESLLEGTVTRVSVKNGWLILELGDVEAGGYALRKVPVYLDAERFDAGEIRIGNRVSVQGEFALFETARNPGEFDYRRYYWSLKMSYRVFGDSLRVTDSGYHCCREGLRRLSEHAAMVLDSIVSEEDAGVLRAVILGDRTALPEEVRSLYQRSGIAHMLAVSGLHLTLVSLAAYGLIRRLGAGYGSAALTGGVLLTAYAILSGCGSSVIRALIMALCGFLAAWLGRTCDLLTALGLSALVIAWDSPYGLSQAGVQLSFAALVGIGGLAPCLEKIQGVDRKSGRNDPESPEKGADRNGQETGKDAKKRRETEAQGRIRRVSTKAAQAFRVSVSMQLVTIPLILYHFFQIPLYSMFLNLIVVPFAGILVGSGAAGIVVGSFSLAGGRFAAGGACAVLRWYEWCCRIFEKLPGSALIAGRPEIWQMGASYGILAGAVGAGMWLMREDMGCRKRRGENARLAVLLVLSVLVLFPVPVRGLEVTFLDVGQGDGICLRTDRFVILADGGSTDQKRLGENCLLPFLKSRGIRTVDYAIVSHGDQDHISGLTYLLEEETGVTIRNLLLPAAGYGDESYETLETLAAERGCAVIWLERGDRLLLGRLTVTCLYPDETRDNPLPDGTDRNEHSLVLRVNYGDSGLLLTGDMSAEGEAELLAFADADGSLPELAGVQVLKVAHHGSKYSTSDVWLDALKPVWAVVSCGEGNRYGHPHAETMERLKSHQTLIYQTTDTGAVTMKTDGKTIRWLPFLSNAGDGKE